MPVLIGVAAVAFLIIVAVLIFASTRPDSFRIERSARIAAPAANVFPLINDFHQWAQWSPWENLDPNMKKTYSGSPMGPGSVYEWTGNNKVGEGRMTILDSKPGEIVSLKLEFFKPFKATNQGTFTLTPADSGTNVNWSMEGKNLFVGKVFSLFMDMDKMVGKDFEKGLANLNAVALAETGKRA